VVEIVGKGVFDRDQELTGQPSSAVVPEKPCADADETGRPALRGASRERGAVGQYRS
jgi:hypothetical protein